MSWFHYKWRSEVSTPWQCRSSWLWNGIQVVYVYMSQLNFSCNFQQRCEMFCSDNSRLQKQSLIKNCNMSYHLLQIGAFVALYVLLLSMSILCKHKVVSFPIQVLLKALERGDKALLFCFTAGQCYCSLHYDQRTINYCALHTNSYWYLRVFKWVTIVYCRVETLVKRHWCK